MPDSVYVSTEEGLKASMSGDHRVTVLKADYDVAIFQKYAINYCFEKNWIATVDCPTNFFFLKHVFHLFNYPDIIDSPDFPYRALMDKILSGHELRIELSLKNTRLLRLCQCLLGVTFIDRNYHVYRDRKGTLPAPYVIGKCIADSKQIPAWSYYWDVSDKEFWFNVEDRLISIISQFNGIFISEKDAEKVWEMFNNIASGMFSIGKSIYTKKLEGPGYLKDSMWNRMFTGLPQDLNLFDHQPAGVNICDAVIATFRNAFYASTYYHSADPFNISNTGYSQMPDVTKTDLAMPAADAVDRRRGLSVDLAINLNSQAKEIQELFAFKADANDPQIHPSLNTYTIDNYCNRIVYTEFLPPPAENYEKDHLGNIIAFKQQLDEGMIIAYPEGRDELATKLSGRTDADKPSEVLVVKEPVSAIVTVKQLELTIKHIAESEFSIHFEGIGKDKKATNLEVLKFLVIYAASADPAAHFVFEDKVNVSIRKDSSRSTNFLDLKCIYNGRDKAYNSSIRTEVNKLIDKFLPPKNAADNYIDIKFKRYEGSNREVRFKNILLEFGSAETRSVIENELNNRSAPKSMQDFILNPIK